MAWFLISGSAVKLAQPVTVRGKEYKWATLESCNLTIPTKIPHDCMLIRLPNTDKIHYKRDDIHQPAPLEELAIAEFLSAQEDRKQLQVRFRKHQKKARDNAHSGAFDLFAAYMTLGTITLAMLIAIIQ